MPHRPNSLVTLIVAALIAPLATVAVANACECEGAVRSGIKEVGAALVIRKPHLNVDADGAPDSYRIDGTGLSYTCDGVLAKENGKRVTPDSDPAHWQAKCNAAWQQARASGDYSGVAIFGFATDANNRPLEQRAGDPLPGEAFISTTTVTIPGTPEGTQRHYVDATRIPYVVVPGDVVSRYGLVPGCLALVYRPSTDKFAFGVYADGGRLGEASVKLHQDLGNEPVQRIRNHRRAKGRIEDRVVIVLFPAAKSPPVADATAWNADIQQQGQAALDAFGGMEKVRACATGTGRQ